MGAASMASMPTAGRPPAPAQRHNGSPPYGGPPVGRPPAELLPVPQYPEWPATSTDDTAEMPIYREMEATWFRGNHSMPMSGPPAVDASGWVDTRPQAGQQWGATTVSAPRRAPAAPPPPRGGGWHTAADEGWRAARSAAEAPVRTQTRNGLPKRVPQAQLVPGGVEGSAATKTAQRTPEDVRGLLSAYHRGVQRGRGIEPSNSGKANS
jgi:hypothetical protein